LSMMLAGAVWALICARPLLEDRRLRNGLLVVAAVVLYAQLLTGGRAGIFTAGLIALTFGIMKWRKILLMVPVVVTVVALFMPAVVERLLAGFTTGANTSTTVDQYEATAGRTIAWPLVIEKISRSPAVGWGRQAMMSSGIAAFLYVFLDEDFGHPHNAYLEWLLDNGIVGFIPLAMLLLVILFHGFRLFLDSRSLLFVAAGGVSCSMLLGLMFSGVTGASFYPVEGTVEMWGGIFLMFRLSVQRKRALAAFRQTAPFIAPPPPKPGFRPRTAAAPTTPRFTSRPPAPRPEAWQFRQAPAADAPRKRFQVFIERT
jgi:O-antigen ligase